MRSAEAEFLRDFNAACRPLYVGLNRKGGRVQPEGSDMCQGATSSGRGSAVAAPRWGVLYAGTLPQLAALGVVEAAYSPHLVRVALRCLIAVGVFATISMWLRTNRPALDLQDWCDCAGAQMTIRVIESRPPQPAVPVAEPLVVAAALEQEYELTGR